MLTMPSEAHNWECRISIAKYDQEQGVLVGWASLSTDQQGRPFVDAQGDIIPIEEIEKAAHALMQSGGTGKADVMHQVFGVGDIVESLVLTSAKRDALKLGDGPQGWVVAIKVNSPEVREAIKAGAALELSIFGKSRWVNATGTV